MRTGDFVLTPSWTFHDHGNLGVGAGDLDGRARHADRQHVRHELCRAPSAGDAAGQPRRKGTRWRGTARTCCRSSTRRRGPSSPAFNYPYSRSREALEQLSRNGADRCVSRREDAVREPGDRRLSDADDRGVHAAAAEGLLGQDLSIDRLDHLSASSKGTAAAAIGAQHVHVGTAGTSSSCRRGSRCRTRRAKRRCSSAPPIAPRRKRWASGAKRTDFRPRS